MCRDALYIILLPCEGSRREGSEMPEINTRTSDSEAEAVKEEASIHSDWIRSAHPSERDALCREIERSFDGANQSSGPYVARTFRFRMAALLEIGVRPGGLHTSRCHRRRRRLGRYDEGRVALPVGAPQRLARVASRFVRPSPTSNLATVGQFDPVLDRTPEQEVCRLLAQARNNCG